MRFVGSQSCYHDAHNRTDPHATKVAGSLARAPQKEILRQQRRAFRRKFGREPGPNDPVFFDPDAPGDILKEIDPNQMRADVLQAMAAAGTPPEIAYAFAKTGYLVVDGLQDRFAPEALEEWDAAIAEYHRLEAEGKLS